MLYERSLPLYTGHEPLIVCIHLNLVNRHTRSGVYQRYGYSSQLCKLYDSHRTTNCHHSYAHYLLQLPSRRRRRLQRPPRRVNGLLLLHDVQYKHLCCGDHRPRSYHIYAGCKTYWREEKRHSESLCFIRFQMARALRSCTSFKIYRRDESVVCSSSAQASPRPATGMSYLFMACHYAML